MKGCLKLVVFIIIVLLCINYKDEITRFFVERFIFSTDSNINIENDYSLNYEFTYLEKTDDFFAKDKEHLINILYTALNNGNEHFYFFCDYENCTNDVDEIISSTTINYINDYIHPFNSYKIINRTIDSLGKVTIDINKFYTEEETIIVNNEIDKIISKIIKSNMSDKEKITAFHNYIIDNTKYDMDYINNNSNDLHSKSHTAIGVLSYNKALCRGYSHTMAVFLNKLKIPNYRISNNEHIWNLVKLDNKWYHLDLTWDDPVASKDIRLSTFLLISNDKLSSLNTGMHNFDKSVFIEAN